MLYRDPHTAKVEEVVNRLYQYGRYDTLETEVEVYVGKKLVYVADIVGYLQRSHGWEAFAYEIKTGRGRQKAIKQSLAWFRGVNLLSPRVYSRNFFYVGPDGVERWQLDGHPDTVKGVLSMYS